LLAVARRESWLDEEEAMNEEDQARVLFAIAAGSVAASTAMWVELLLRRPLLGLLVAVIAILAGTGIVVYDLQTEQPTER
jgi:hypothetical protein